MHAISGYRGNRPTNTRTHTHRHTHTHTHKHTHTHTHTRTGTHTPIHTNGQNRLQYTAPQLALSVKRSLNVSTNNITVRYITRSSADADNRLDAFSGQSRSTNMVPFHMLYIVSYCAIVTLSLRRAVFTIFVFKKFHDLEMGVKGH